MKKLAIAFLAMLGLTGCVVAPVGEPGVYVAPPTVVVQPYGYYSYGYYRYGPRYQHHHGGYYRGG